MDDLKQSEWEESYSKGQNYMYYPKEQTVRFLNRFISKKTGINQYNQIYRPNSRLKALDFGCGIGSNTILMHDFNIEAYGIDISLNALKEAKENASSKGYDLDQFFMHFDGERLPFKNSTFDFAISECVLDSMPFQLAKSYVKEISRVTKGYFYLSLMSSTSTSLFDDLKDEINFDGEIIVTQDHENGTVQSLFNRDKIDSLIAGTGFHIKDIYLIEESNIRSSKRDSRWHIVLEETS